MNESVNRWLLLTLLSCGCAEPPPEPLSRTGEPISRSLPGHAQSDAQPVLAPHSGSTPQVVPTVAPQDVDALMDLLLETTFGPPGPYVGLMDALRAKRDASAMTLARALEHPRAQQSGPLKEAILYAMGELGHDHAVPFLLAVLEPCAVQPTPEDTPRSKAASLDSMASIRRESRPEPAPQCHLEPSDGDLERPGCAVADSLAVPQLVIEQSAAIASLRQIVARYQSHGHKAQFETALRRIVANEQCNRHLVGTAAALLVHHSRNPEAERRQLKRELGEREELAMIEFVQQVPGDREEAAR